MTVSRGIAATSLGSKLCIVLVLMAIASFRSASCATSNLTTVLEGILNGYDNRIRPNGVEEAPTGSLDSNEEIPLRVRVELYIESVDSIKESTMDFSLTVYLRLFWLDTRLAFPGYRSLVLGSQGIQKIWIPDIYFLYEKNARLHTVTQSNQLMRIQPNGTVSYSSRISLTVACNMNLQKFPMDSQKCTITMSSYAYSVEELILYADNRSIGMEPNITISKFTLTDMGVENDQVEFLGNFSSIRCNFFFMRQMESYFLTVYIPTVLLVTIAWLSFWIDAKAAPARVALGITTVLTVTTMTSGIQETLPVVTYAKAIDIWLAVCLMFVFFSLLEYGLANFLLVKQANMMTPSPSTEATKSAGSLQEGPLELIQGQPLTADRLDHYARLGYPLAFLTFAICYWIIFLTM